MDPDTRLFQVRKKLFHDLVQAASTFVDCTMMSYGYSSCPFSSKLRLMTMVSTGEKARTLRNAGWTQLYVFLESIQWDWRLLISESCDSWKEALAKLAVQHVNKF